MLSSNFRVGQAVNRQPGLGVVVIGLVYHGVLEVPREPRRWPATPYLANQVHVTSLVVGLLYLRDILRRPVQNPRLRRWHCVNTVARFNHRECELIICLRTGAKGNTRWAGVVGGGGENEVICERDARRCGLLVKDWLEPIEFCRCEWFSICWILFDRCRRSCVNGGTDKSGERYAPVVRVWTIREHKAIDRTG